MTAGHPKAVCLSSGGLDSAVSAAVAKSRGFELYLLFFDYGQRSCMKESLCFRAQSEFLQPAKSKEVRLSWYEEIGGTLLVGEGDSLSAENRDLEYVPFRNGLFLSFGVAWAEALGGDAVFFGSTKGATVCPDNSPVFFDRFSAVVEEGTKSSKTPRVEVPLLQLSKAEVIELGISLDVPFALTWSCHNRNNSPCGTCSNCEERFEAFLRCGFSDPLLSERASADTKTLERHGQ